MSCSSLCNVPRAGGGRWQDTCAHDITGRAQAVLVQPEDAVSAAIDVRVPRAEGGTDVPACAGCPGIVDCARGFTLLTPGPSAPWDTSEQKSDGMPPTNSPRANWEGKKGTGTPVSDAAGRVLVMRGFRAD